MSESEETMEELNKTLKEFRETHPILSEIYDEYKTFQDISNEYLEKYRPRIYKSSVNSDSSPRE